MISPMAAVRRAPAPRRALALRGLRQRRAPGAGRRLPRARAARCVFERELRKDRISGWRWFLGAWGVGTYRQDDSVDVRYERADGSPAWPRSSTSSALRASPGGGRRAVRSRSHGAQQRSALRIARVAGRAVERVEVDAGRAVGQQVGALQRRVGDAEARRPPRGSSARARARVSSAVGDRRAAHARDALDLVDVVIGMMPGTIGTSMPIARARRDEVEVERVVEEQLRDEEARAGVGPFGFLASQIPLCHVGASQM